MPLPPGGPCSSKPHFPASRRRLQTLSRGESGVFSSERQSGEVWGPSHLCSRLGWVTLGKSLHFSGLGVLMSEAGEGKEPTVRSWTPGGLVRSMICAPRTLLSPLEETRSLPRPPVTKRALFCLLLNEFSRPGVAASLARPSAEPNVGPRAEGASSAGPRDDPERSHAREATLSM